ncbi:MAG: hypothetical protein Q7S19_01855 [bacterium]|nr:hypothetical protein [bacterium]
MNIIPAIIGKDFNEVEEKALSVKNFTTWVHLDIMDGLFTPTESWSYFDIKKGQAKDLKVEVHLMTRHPLRILSKWIEAGVDRVMVHYESTDVRTLANILQELNDSEVEAGIVLEYETPISVLDQFIDQLDVVQLMGIAHIGFYGHPLEYGIYDKVKSLRAKYPGVTISVDGGVNLKNAEKLMKAGADNLVIGSAIFRSENIEETIKNFKNIK